MGGNGFGRRTHLRLVHKNPHRRRPGVFILAAPHSPEERPQKRRREQQAQGNEDEYDDHDDYWANTDAAL